MYFTKPTRSQPLIGESVQPVTQCSRMSQRLTLLLGLTLVCSGCSLTNGLNNYIAYNDNSNDFVMGWRNEVWASQAWHNQKQYFFDHPEFRAFGAGFRDGYQAVASGGTGCPPPMPPRKYWTWKYQTAEGQCKVAAWFEGYTHGARAADEDGAGNFQDIQVSYLIEAQYSPEFQAGQIPSFAPDEYIVPGEPMEMVPNEPPPEAIPLLAPPISAEGPGIAPASWTAPASWNTPASWSAPASWNAPTPVTGWPMQLPPPIPTVPR